MCYLIESEESASGSDEARNAPQDAVAATDEATVESVEQGWGDQHGDSYDYQQTDYEQEYVRQIEEYKAYSEQLNESIAQRDVYIENQPTFINPTMKTISSMLFSYFLMRGIHEKETTKSTIENINFCSPSNKIKIGGKNTENEIKTSKENIVYKLTKSLAVKFTRSLIEDTQEYLDLFNCHTKKDDLADAFLQGFMKVFPIVPDHYTDKIKNICSNDEKIKYSIKGKNTDSNKDKEITIKIGKKV